MSPHERVWTVVVAGGSGQRFGRPKQFESLVSSDETIPDASGHRVLDRSVSVAAAASEGVVVVVPADLVDRELATFDDPRVRVVAGGASRAASVRSGLAAVAEDATVICVHDAARPFAGPELFASVVAAVSGATETATGDGVATSRRADGAVPGVPVSDTIKVVSGHVVVSTPDRSTLVAVQTPQAFRADVLRAVHAATVDGITAHAATDDASMVEAAGGVVVVVPGDPGNVKITHPEDLDRARDRVAAERRDDREAT